MLYEKYCLVIQYTQQFIIFIITIPIKLVFPRYPHILLSIPNLFTVEVFLIDWI